MSATDVDVEAATKAETPPTPDGSAEPKPTAEPAPAVKDPDEAVTQGVRSRIDELTRYRREAERERDYWREIAEKSREAKPPEPIVEVPAKTLAEFGYDESKYQAYLFGEAQNRSVKAARAELDAEREREVLASLQADHADREAKYAETVPDYYDLVHKAPNDGGPAISDTMAQTIMESENGPQIAHHLAKNPRLARQIYALPPLRQALEIGKMEAKLSQAPPAPKVSQAPPPAAKLAPVEGSTDKKVEDMTDLEFAKMRRRQIAQRRMG